MSGESETRNANRSCRFLMAASIVATLVALPVAVFGDQGPSAQCDCPGRCSPATENCRVLEVCCCCQIAPLQFACDCQAEVDCRATDGCTA